MRDINWLNTDIITDLEIYTNKRFFLMGGKAKILEKDNTLIEEMDLTEFSYIADSRYKALGDKEWIVHKLKCNCPK